MSFKSGIETQKVRNLLRSGWLNNFFFQEGFGENRKAMIVGTKHGEAAEPDHVILVDVVGLADRQVHSQLLCKCLHVGKVPCFHKCYDIWLLLLYNAANERKTVFSSSENIVAEDA